MDYVQARINMVENQLRPNRIDDPAVLLAMGAVPRERFLPKALQGIAYADEDLVLPDGSFLIDSLVLARLLQTVAIRPGEVVLVTGCATGYVSAVVARLAGTVISIQPDQANVDRIQPALDQLEADNVVATVKTDPLSGDAEQAPFDVILPIGAVPAVPAALLDQLGEDGRLVAVIEDGRVGKGTLYTRAQGAVGHRVLFDAQLPKLPGLQHRSDFAF
jgi:protein-L-isoaspartate(D-aspartate) O-methyltransferase